MDTYKLRTALGLVSKAFKKYHRQFLLMVTLGFLAGIFGSIGIGAVIPLFSFLTNNNAVGNDLISQTIGRFFSLINLPYTLPYLLIFMVLLFVLKAITNFSAGYINSRITSRYEKDMRADLFRKIIGSNWLHLIEQKPGYVERVLMSDIYSSSNILMYVGTIMLTLASLATYTLVALNISPPITLITLLLGAIIFLALKPLFYKSRKVMEKLALTDKATAHHILQTLFGMKIVKSSNAENKVSKIAEADFEDLEKRRVQAATYQTFIGSVTEPIGIAFIAMVFLFSYRSPAFNIAAFGAIVYMVQKMFSFIQVVQGKINNINSIIPFLQTTLDYREKAINNQESHGGTEEFSFDHKLEFKNISFAYNEEAIILKNLNFDIKSSEMVGFIGPSGGGKTTLVDIILRLFAPGAGEILIDGKDINSINLKSWRSSVGYVSQDVFLINDTLENNIKFYDETISHAGVVEAAKMANIYDFIQTLPGKFETNIGERGIKLSGGQRQRVALARTLARKPKILILDEATSSLDSESEALIQNSIKNLRGKTTLIVIAHRLSTIQNADRLFSISDGEIIESGPPEELLKNKDSYFYKVYNIT